MVLCGRTCLRWYGHLLELGDIALRYRLTHDWKRPVISNYDDLHAKHVLKWSANQKEKTMLALIRNVRRIIASVHSWQFHKGILWMILSISILSFHPLLLAQTSTYKLMRTIKFAVPDPLVSPYLCAVELSGNLWVASSTVNDTGALNALFEADPANTDQDTNPEYNAQFLQLCDLAVAKLKDEKSKDPFFIDSYCVRSLCVAYDITRNKKYLEACCSWSKKMVNLQKKMIPAGAYYMNYCRKPGEAKGDWYVADCSSIAMAVLTTAVRCHDAEQKRFLNSVQRFASLVIENYIRHSGGVTDGLWLEFDGEWWCSSGLFGSLLFMLYKNTGDERYLNVGLGVVDWLNNLDLSKTKPLPLTEQGPSMPMYILETYSAGWPYLSKDSTRKEAAFKKISWCLNWITDQQQQPVSQRQQQFTEWWRAKYGGLPFHQYIFSRYFARQDLMIAADREMQQLAKLAFANEHAFTQLEAFMMMSYAERLHPGAIYSDTCDHAH